MRCGHGISITAPALFYLPPSLAVAWLFQTNPFVQPTLLLQPKKVGKKGRSMTIALHPIIRESQKKHWPRGDPFAD